MDSAYFRRLEAAFIRIEEANSDVERQQLILAYSNSDPDLVDELSTLIALQKEQMHNRTRASEKNFFDLLLTTLGEGSRKDTTDSLLDFLSEASGSSSEEVITSLRGFSFTRLIATGPTGFVFEGVDETLGRRVAIKVLAPSIATDLPSRERFLNEAVLASSINHENVIDVYHVSTDQLSKIVFFVMEWYEGESLQHWLNGDYFTKESSRFRLSIFQELACGLDAIHQAGIIHRDLKPGNVMINEVVGTLKILDFGIAINSVTTAQTIVPAGTPLYMAPEQMAGDLPTPSTDLFALAEIACVLFAGYHPFEANNLEDLHQKLLAGPERLRTDPSISKILKSVLLKGLSHEPVHRFEDGNSFRLAIEETMNSAGTTAGRLTITPEINSTAETSGQTNKQFRESTSTFWKPFGWVLATVLLIGFMYLAWNQLDAGVGVQPRLIENVTLPKKGEWISESHFKNYEEIGFEKVSLGEASRDQKDQFAKEHPELSRNLGWSNFDPNDRWLVQQDLVSAELYHRVMGLQNTGRSEDAPISNINYYDVKEFCEKLSKNCPDGLFYRPVSKNQLCFAMFGKRHFIDGVAIEDLNSTFKKLSLGQVPPESDSLSLPLVDGLFGRYWEWTDSYTIKSANPNGVVSYTERIETPHERSQQIMGGGQTDIFVHRLNMASGMNDFYHESDNLVSVLEEDGQTAYLHPVTCDRPGWVSYRYKFPKGILGASIGNGLDLLREDSKGGIKVRFRTTESDPKLDKCEWHEIYEGAESTIQPFTRDAISPTSFDVSDLLSGAIDVEIKYWLQSPEEPTYYEQLARTVDTRSQSNRTLEFEVTSGGRLESMRQFSTVPASFRHPLLSFRVMAKAIVPNQD